MNHTQASILDHEEVARILKTDLKNGLTSFEARERLKRYGQNRLENESPKTAPKYFYQVSLEYARQLKNPLIQLLIVCVIISMAIAEYENALSVIISISILCTVSFVQERRADKSLEKLNKQTPSVCKVIRENQIHELESHYLVPGDIIILSEGQRVPADVRLFDLQRLTVNEANLTGETQSQPKIVEPTSSELTLALSGHSQMSSSQSSSSLSSSPSPSSPPPSPTTIMMGNTVDKEFVFQNLALMGTMVESGRSQGIVISTGKSTRYSDVFCALKNTVEPRIALQAKIDQLSIHLVVILCSIIALMSILGIIQHRPALEAANHPVSIAALTILEVLPVVLAVIMALSVLRFGEQKTIVKSLNSIETLGCIQVLCADKTGTLTRDDMTLTDIITSEFHSISSGDLDELNDDEHKKPMTFNKLGGKMYSIARLMEVGTLCNNASFDPTTSEVSNTGKGRGQMIGQATECAILDAAIRLGFGDSRTKFDRLGETPFNSSTRRMSVLCQRRDLPGTSPMYYVKGAWEDILKDCTHYYECGLIKPKNDEMWLEYARVCTTLGSQGLRVLALATGPSLEELTFVGVVGINNAPREGIANTLSRLRNDFYIDIKMITGDSRATAVAVGRSLNLIPPTGDGDDDTEERSVMSGKQFQKILNSEMDDSAKAHEISSRSVFYRVDPIQKANIISKLQELDQIVAMTGDGVNDVISLKRANLSLAMGSGAAVCKEVADIVIVDNDLSILVSAIAFSAHVTGLSTMLVFASLFHVLLDSLLISNQK